MRDQNPSVSAERASTSRSGIRQIAPPGYYGNQSAILHEQRRARSLLGGRSLPETGLSLAWEWDAAASTLNTLPQVPARGDPLALQLGPLFSASHQTGVDFRRVIKIESDHSIDIGQSQPGELLTNRFGRTSLPKSVDDRIQRNALSRNVVTPSSSSTCSLTVMAFLLLNCTNRGRTSPYGPSMQTETWSPVVAESIQLQ
jgi:hypothetical protein